MEENINLRENGITRLETKETKMVVSAKEMQRFKMMMNRRDLRKSQVNSITSALVAGKHFEAPFVCNYLSKGGVYKVIDGNHRMTGMEQFFSRYPNRKIEINIKYYTDLNEDEEREKFSLWNKGVTQTSKDILKLYWSTIPVTKLLCKPQFPVEVSYKWTRTAIDLKLLIGPYLTRESQSTLTFASNGHALVKQLQQLTHNDVKILKEFVTEYMAVFGLPDKNSVYYKYSVFVPLMRIWLKNYNSFIPSVIKRKFVKMRGSERAMYWSTQSSSRISIACALRDYLELINSGIKKPTNIFKG